MNPVLAGFRRRRPLLYDLIDQIHPERWRALGLTPSAAKRLAACPRSRHALSRRLDWAGLADVDGDGGEDWNLDAGRPEAWALRSGDDLWRAGLRFGAARFRTDIARLVWRKDIVTLKAEVGEDAYRFAVRRAALSWPDAGLGAAGTGGTLGENIVDSAVLALGCWLAALPRGLAARAGLKLPPRVNAAENRAAEWPAERRAACLAVLGRVFAQLPA